MLHLGLRQSPLKGGRKDSHQLQPLLGQGELHARPVCSKQVISLVSTKASRLDNPQQEKPAMTLHFRFEREKSSHLGSAKRNWQCQEHSGLLRP